MLLQIALGLLRDAAVLPIGSVFGKYGRKSFSSIRFLAAEDASSAEYFLKKSMRDKEARLQYRRSRRTGAGVNDIFMLDIMREGMEHGDSRLR